MESVLIVDDEIDNLEALRRLLRHDFKVTTTESGLEALMLLRAQEFAVIVSDQRMPEITGVDLLEKAKQLRPAMTRVLLTGYTEVESVIGAINRGSIYRYVAKPWDPEDLRITLRQAAEAFRLRKDLDEKNAALQKSNESLQSALDQLQILDRAKARFLSLVSHELNTPLTAVVSFVSLLGESKASFSEEVQRAVTSLTGASNRLGEIIDEVLTYVRLEADTQWSESTFDWEKETRAVVGALEASRAKKKIEIAVQGKVGLVTQCCPDKMRVALTQLVKEAVARSPQSERVTVAFSQEAENVVFKVRWKGDPLPATALQAFETGGKQQHHHRNLALGLAVAKLVAERHGGRLVSEAKSATLQLVVPAKA